MSYNNCKAANVKYKDIQFVRTVWLNNSHGIQEMNETVLSFIKLFSKDK